MKKSILALSAMVLFFLGTTPASRASSQSITCDGLRNPDLQLVLTIVNQDVKQIEVINNGAPGNFLPTIRLSNQDEPGEVLYSVIGFNNFLSIQTSVLMGSGGTLTLGDDDYSCE